MGKQRFNFTVRGNFIQGEFVRPTDPNGEWVSRSPADFTDELGRFQYSYASVDEAVNSARGAFKAWRVLSNNERCSFLKKYQTAMKRREEELSEAIAREVGKPLWEAQSEVASLINMIDVILAEGLKYVTDVEITNIQKGTTGYCRYRPMGVMAVIGPFNCPGTLPHAHLIPALMMGNTVVFKPSEKAPIVGQLFAECFQEAGFPAGVFNLLQGEKETGRRLCVHEGINGILFTGSYETGTRIKQDTLQQHWKLLALEMGGKNPAIIWNDAKLDVAIYETLIGAFLSAGQRCNSTSRVIVHRRLLDEFVTQFHERAKAFSIGHPLDQPFMGPLIDQGSVDRYMKFLGIASREGCELVMRGKALELPTRGNFVTPSICLAKEMTVDQTKKSIFQQTELFGPNISVIGVDDIEEAVEQANATQYGLVASVFTQNKEVYEKFWDGLEMGLIYWNKSTINSSMRLPFGGLKKSGNYFPTGVMATSYCTVPISSLETSEPILPTDISKKSLGINWN